MVDEDESLLCASAWNDNGSAALAKDKKRLFRSDFFPGLGWMMSEHIWRELAPKWPKAYWDDWLREPQQRKNRNVIRWEGIQTIHPHTSGSLYIDLAHLTTRTITNTFTITTSTY